MPFQTWLGGAVAEALQAPKTTPIIARPLPSAECPRACVLDRKLLPEGTERIAAANRREAQRTFPPLDHGMHTKKVLDIPERLVSLLLQMPYQAVKRAQAAGLSAAITPYNFGDWPTRELALEGPAETVADMVELIEGMLWDLHQRHGLHNEELRQRVATAEAKRHAQPAQPTQPEKLESSPRGGHEEGGVFPVRVSVDGTEETVHVDKEMGPLWWHHHLRPTFGPLDNGRLAIGTKEWREMSTTEREVFLIMTAKRQRQLQLQST